MSSHGEVADEVYVKRCMRCGKKIVQPVLYKGYVFCSDTCRDAFMSTEHGSG